MTGDATVGGVTAGLKAGGDLDVALVVNEGLEFGAAAVLTTNRVQAAPVVDLGAGDAAAWVWTSDLTAAYVHENSAYSP